MHREEPRRQGPIRRHREGERLGVGGHRRRKGDPQPATRRDRLRLAGVDEPLRGHAVEPADDAPSKERGHWAPCTTPCSASPPSPRRWRRPGPLTAGAGAAPPPRPRKIERRIDAWRPIVTTVLAALRADDAMALRWPDGPHGLAHLHRAPAGRVVRRHPRRRGRPPNGSGSAPSSAAITTSRWATSPVSPGPSDAWITLAGLARDTTTSASARSSRRRRSGCPGRSRSRWPASTRCRAVGSSSGSAPAGTRPSTPRTASRSPTSGRGSTASRSSWRSSPVCGARRRVRRTRSTASTTSSPTRPHFRSRSRRAARRSSSAARDRTRTPALAAQYAAEFNFPFAPVEAFAEQRDRVIAACETIDRDPATMMWSTAVVVCAARRRGGCRAAGGGDRARPGRAAPQWCCRHGRRDGGDAARWNDAGVDRIYLQILDLADLEHLDLLATRSHRV